MEPGRGQSFVCRDPVHGLIRFAGADAGLASILDTAAMQRLRRIRQMGFASLVYPGAEHTRFGHALGAAHVAGRVTAALGLPDDIARDVKVGALLHDVGHGPFSHAWEVALAGPSHEAWGARILAEDEELRAALARIAPELPERVSALFAKKYRPSYAVKLVSSQLDVDRMDYLLRDAHAAGVGYSAYDLDWVIHALRVEKVRGGDDPEDLVLDWSRGLHAVEQFLAGRFYMYAQVYYHKTVRAAETMFLFVMRRFAELARTGREPAGLPTAGRMARGESVSVASYLALDDAKVSVALDAWTHDPDAVLAELARGLTRRRLWKTIDLGSDPEIVDTIEARLAERARAELGAEVAPWAWAIDRGERLGYKVAPGQELVVVGHPGGPAELATFMSGRALSAQAFSVRVLCAPALVDGFKQTIAGAR